MTPFLDTFDRYQAAVLAKDIDVFIALYADGVVVYDAWEQWSVDGLAAWRTLAAGWFASLGEERVAVTVADAHCVEAGELAVGHAVVTYTALAPDGQALRALDNRLTWTLRQSEGVWRIVHEHTSAPIDHESGRAILRRVAAPTA